MTATANALLAGCLSGLFVFADLRPPPPPPPGAGIQFEWSNQSWEVGFTFRESASDTKTLTFSRQGATHLTWLLFDDERLRFDADKAEAASPEASERSWRHPALDVRQRVVKLKGAPPSRTAASLAAKTHDTALVVYEIANLDSVPHRLGLQALIDTRIAGNDAHPFAAPGKLGLINTSADFKGRAIPTYVWALESPDPLAPGFRAIITLKVGGDVPHPDHVWVHSSRDAMLALFWHPREVPPRESIRFAYGIGLGLATGSSLPPR